MKKYFVPILILGLVAMALAAPLGKARAVEAQHVDNAALFHDPADPVTGNPKGNLTIVEFSDYNCPFCKRAAAALDKLVKEDGEIRVVHKDWPVLSEASVYGARMALAAGYQGKYADVHGALLHIPGMKISQDRMREAIQGAGVDMTRLEADLKTHAGDIAGVLDKTAEQAESLGLEGTPAFLVGPYIVPSALDYAGFKQVVDAARKKTNS